MMTELGDLVENDKAAISDCSVFLGSLVPLLLLTPSLHRLSH